MQAVILAGGKGTRIRELVGDMPKPMLAIGGMPLLEHQVRLVRKHGVRRILMLVAHNPHFIMDYFGDGARWDVEISYRKESAPLGTAGAVLNAWEDLDDRFLVLYGDTMLNVDLSRFGAAHARSGAAATLFLHPNDHPHDSDVVEVGDQDRIRAFHPYPHPEGIWLPNLVNAALYMMDKAALQSWKTVFEKADFGKDLFPRMLEKGQSLFGYRSPEYIKDVGTVRRHEEVSRDLASGRVARGSLEVAKPAIFLDRDGTLVADRDGMTAPEQLALLAGVPEAIRAINRSDYYAIVVTNQPVIAKGQCSLEQLKVIHNKLETLLGQGGAYLDAIYYCPHHPERGFPGERAEYKIDCTCRKPSPGMIQQAVCEYNIDLARSWMIGDTTRDIETARRAGVRSVLVRTGYGGEDKTCPGVKAEMNCADLSEAVALLLRGSP